MKIISTLFLSSLLLVFFAGCGQRDGRKNEKSPAKNESRPVEINQAGIISPEDATDPDHAGLVYDPHIFNAEFGDKVLVTVQTEDFDPLLKLVEVSTGAVLAEWDPKYSGTEGLNYTIAGTGKYEARVYAMKKGTGNYSLTIQIK